MKPIKYTKEELEKAVKNSFSFSGVCRYFDVKPAGNVFYIIKDYIKKYEINTSHFLGKNTVRIIGPLKKKTWKEILSKNSNFRIRSKDIRRALIESGKKYKCEKCPNEGEWLGQKIRLHVDHIDGNCKNNDIENLQFLCPNCHGVKTYRIEEKIDKRSLRKERPLIRKVERPSKEELENFIKNMPLTSIGKKFGVSDNSIRKWCKYYQIDLKNRKGSHGRMV